jgi:hypothetical protein
MALRSPIKSFQKQSKALVKKLPAKPSIINPTHKRAEGRAPVWGSKLETAARLKRNLCDLTARGLPASLPTESNLEQPSEKSCASAA